MPMEVQVQKLLKQQHEQFFGILMDGQKILLMGHYLPQEHYLLPLKIQLFMVFGGEGLMKEPLHYQLLLNALKLMLFY